MKWFIKKLAVPVLYNDLFPGRLEGGRSFSFVLGFKHENVDYAYTVYSKYLEAKTGMIVYANTMSFDTCKADSRLNQAAYPTYFKFLSNVFK